MNKSRLGNSSLLGIGLLCLATIYSRAQQVNIGHLKSSVVTISPQEYNNLKNSGNLDFTQGNKYNVEFNLNPNDAFNPRKAINPENPKAQNYNSCLPYEGSCSMPGYTLVPGINTGNDDGFSTLINLPFDFCLYGTTYNSCYINNNGNISFTQGIAGFSSTGFPNADAPMIAPFWADWDTRPFNTGVGCLVQMQITSGYLRVLYHNIGYFSQQTDKVNNCELIITDGNDPILPAGNNCAFLYGDMQWTTGSASNGVNGFGGIPATVGANKGDGTNFFQIGRFDHEGVDYDGPFTNVDGVSWLDNKTFVFDVCGSTTSSNLPPVSIANYTNCNTQVICSGDTLFYDYSFVGPEDGQNVTLSLDTGLGIPGTQITLLNSGTFGSLQFIVVNTVANGQTYNLGIVATDNGTPAQSTTINLTIALGNDSIVNLDPHVIGNPIQCNGDTNLLTIDVPSSQYLALAWSNNTFNDTLNTDEPGQYWATVTANGCQTFLSDTFTITNVNPEVTITGVTDLCGETTTLNAVSPTANLIWWSNGDTVLNNVPEVFNQSGNYTAYVTESGCKDSLVVAVNLNPIPAAPMVSGNLYTCNGANANLGAPSGFSGYAWSTGAVTQSVSVPEGNYTLIVSQSYPNSIVCNSPPTTVIVSNSNANVSILGNDTVCSNLQLLSLSLADTSLVYTYLWNDGSTGDTNLTAGYPDTSWVISTDQFGCVDTDQFVFWSFAPPTAFYTVQPPLLSPTLEDVVFTDSSYTNSPNDVITSWHWNFGNQDDPNLSDDTSNIQSPIHQFADGDTGQITLSLIVINSIGCSDTLEIPYTIANEILTYNAFTPNGDGKNDYFVIDYLIQKYPKNNLRVYNRWGRKIYEKDNYRNDWDFEKHTAGTYYFILTHKDGSVAKSFTIIKD